MPVPKDQSFVTVADPENFGHPISMPKLHDQPANHVIHTRAQTTAGDNRGGRRSRIEIDAFSRPCDFKCQAIRVGPPILPVHAIVANNSLRIDFKFRTGPTHVREARMKTAIA
jgi:hypothetical protein